MAYSADTFVADEQPTTAKWNKLWANDAAFNDGSGFANGALGSVHASLANGIAVQNVYASSGSVMTGTTVIPLDNTIPQITEGVEYLTATITPKSTTNRLVIQATIPITYSVTANLIACIFQDANANALLTGWNFTGTAGAPSLITLTHEMAAGTTSATTFRLRAGSNSAGTATINGSGGVAFFGGTLKTEINITEYKSA